MLPLTCWRVIGHTAGVDTCCCCCFLFVCGTLCTSGLVAPVITEFPGITVGGAIMGGALESSSFRNQHFADALVSLQVVTADGAVLECSAEKHADLFYGIRGSYGTIARVTLCTLRLERLADLALQGLQAIRAEAKLEVLALQGTSSPKRVKLSEDEVALPGGAIDFKVQV